MVGDGFATEVTNVVVVIVYVIGYSFSANVTDMVVVVVNMVGDSLAADVANVVVVIVYVIGDSFATDITDVIFIAVNMVGDGFATEVTNVVVVIVCMVGNGFPTDVTKVVMILIRVVGNGFTADVTLMVGILVFVRARVCTNGANAVFEGMRRFLHRDLAAAVPFLGMRCFGLFPDFLASVVLGVQFAVCFAANFADSFVFASSRSAGVSTGIFADFANPILKFVVMHIINSRINRISFAESGKIFVPSRECICTCILCGVLRKIRHRYRIAVMINTL